MVHIVVVWLCGPKGGARLTTNKKIGRPTDSPKRHSVKARVDDQTLQILDQYCKENDKNRAEGIRDGIQRLKDGLQEK